MAVAVTGVGLVWAQIETASHATLPCLPAGATAPPSAVPTQVPTSEPILPPAGLTVIPPRGGGDDPVAGVSPLPTPTATPPEGITEDTTVGQPVPTVAPRATAAPCPRTRHSLFGSGPLTVSGNGGLDLGEHDSSTSGGFSQNQGQVGLSMLFELARRTQQTSLVIDQGIGGSQNAYNLSQVSVGYSTPNYLASFGPVNGPNDTQLSSGSYNRGLTMTFPRGQDEIDLIAARTTGSTGESFSVAGLRHSRALKAGLLFSQALYLARGDNGGSDGLLDLALGRYRTGQTYRGEVAVSSSHGLFDVADGNHIAYALHADLSGKVSSTSLAFTSIPDDFAALGQVQYAQRSFLGSYRRTLHRGDFTAEVSTISSNVGGQVSSTQQQTGALDLPFLFHGTMNLSESLELSSSQGATSLDRTSGLTLNEIFAGTGLTQTISLSSFSSNGVAPSVQTATPTNGTQSEYDLGLSRSLFRGFLTSQFSHNVYSSAGTQTVLNSGGFTYDHPLGRKADVAYSYNVQRVVNNGIDAQTVQAGALGQATTTISVTRRLSPLVALRVLEGETTQVGAGGGSAHYLNVDVVGPLAIGNAARYTGRGNPNLPAVVTGHVYLVQAASSFGLVGNLGIPNVLITIDGATTQRTDTNGAYEFQFVKPGLHTITIADATLPVGAIADTSTQSFTVQGGQVATVDFAAGAFAGIGGFVLSELGGGGTQAIPGIDIVVDGQQHGYTGPDGHYQIGHLQPGRHTVAIDADSLPATVQLNGPTEQNVDVVEGRIATLNWTVQGLGSIQGSVLYASNAGFGNLVGARNIYVVAEPGDRAAITDDDGNFIIDNVPSGNYTLSLDADTIPDGQGIIQAPDGSVAVTANNAVDGLLFKLGPVAKAVVFTFNGSSQAPAISANFSPQRVPDGAIVTLRVSVTDKRAKAVTARGDGFGSIAFHKDGPGQWSARVFVPETMSPGQHSVRVAVTGGKGGSADAALTIDPKIALVVAHTQPSHPRPGELVKVALRVLADVGEGDKVYFEDGATATLGSPSGQVYAFTIRMWSKPGPYQGLLITRRGQRLQFTILAAAP
jgi:hypothetical protein